MNAASTVDTAVDSKAKGKHRDAISDVDDDEKDDDWKERRVNRLLDDDAGSDVE